ncbi:N-acetylmuramoyl-L-alanine amidase [Paracoccus litorisediminis]|uniref:N-acetylmuramoyl-L-alanine amidase n=2 Tax=Paracoccus litorisediminis TaxID=2006130 RepID=A0A844HQ02_9RHOB|nr:N-acetylmuramoyl-L-alanine amidase [Paracoccus litorisediminis]
MPPASMNRIILHWTAGGYRATNLDRSHYHLLVEGDGVVVRGVRSIKANERIGSKSADSYAAHTLGCNTGSIGISMCSMVGAIEVPFSAGKCPLTEVQWQRAAEVVADLCKFYGIAISDKTVLSHAEVQPNLGIKQKGKWDITRLPWNPALKGPAACGNDFRRRVKEAML